jgi:hypothetical protein
MPLCGLLNRKAALWLVWKAFFFMLLFQYRTFFDRRVAEAQIEAI